MGLGGDGVGGNDVRPAHGHNLGHRMGAFQIFSAWLTFTLLHDFAPCLQEYPYDAGDVIGVYNSFDLLVLQGRSKRNITGLRFQEVKTGSEARSIWPDSNEGYLRTFIDSLDDPRIQFEHWARRDADSVFTLVNHKRKG